MILPAILAAVLTPAFAADGGRLVDALRLFADHRAQRDRRRDRSLGYRRDL
jgi:hypothetical protein